MAKTTKTIKKAPKPAPMYTGNPELSVVIPVYNEQESLPTLFKRQHAYLVTFHDAENRLVFVRERRQLQDRSTIYNLSMISQEWWIPAPLSTN